ncbi:hypothetical protein RQP46_010345 [Phenoliferia psychrophenolica]
MAALDHPTTLYEVFTHPTHGTALRATSDLSPGQLIIAEAPLLHIPKVLMTNHQNNAFALTKEVLKVTLAEGTADQKMGFLRLSNTFTGEHGLVSDGTGGEKKMDPLTGTFLSNAIETLPTHAGVFAISSRINHSCTPNAMASYSSIKKVLSVYALVAIPAQTEILFSYIDPLAPIQDRQLALWQRFRFRCRCSVCALGLGRVLEKGDPLLLEQEKADAENKALVLSSTDGEKEPTKSAVEAEENAVLSETVLPGTDVRASELSELRRKRIVVLKQLLHQWDQRKVPAWTVMKFARQVLEPKGILETEGLEGLKGDLWRDICKVAACHSSISQTRSSSTAAIAAYTISNGPNCPSVTELRSIPKDPRKHPLWGRRDYVDFDAPIPEGVNLTVLGWEDEAKKSRKKKNKKKNKAKVLGGEGANGNGAAKVVGEGAETEGDSA